MYRRTLALTEASANAAEGIAVSAERDALTSAWSSFFRESGFAMMMAPVTVSTAFDSNHALGQDAYTAGRTFFRAGVERDYGTHFFWPHLSIVAKLPAVAVPIGCGTAGGSASGTASAALPMSVQLIGPPGADAELLQHAGRLASLCKATGPPPGCK